MSHPALRKRSLELLLIGLSPRKTGASPTCQTIRASEWPNSPDLNVDFFVWAMLEEKALRKSMENALSEIPRGHVRAAVKAYPKRLKAVIRAKGGHIERSLGD
ncbi:hypothetical protein ANCDUO_00397 [Ancylostoma duodenale]|uniref:Uncharacterized protein n=1 Tax=Ancylostoma duodenale TaxID=51022 RepID=A0A0C2HC79_9BILA|nr:hypothetical protein ANCDUO_00397 [Ancylostoma duodenale]